MKALNGEDDPTHPRFAIYPKDENPARGNWSNRAEYFLSSMGFVVGMGNIWRFPYKCYVYGGGKRFIEQAFYVCKCCELQILCYIYIYKWTSLIMIHIADNKHGFSFHETAHNNCQD